MMSKAKPIDRLALTRAKFGAKMYGDAVREVGTAHAEHYNVIDYEPQDDKPASAEHWGISECPMCKRMTLKHEGGCVQCTSCGWSACG